MGEVMEEAEADEVIGYIDGNGDGKIDYEEFLTMMLECELDEFDSDPDIDD